MKPTTEDLQRLVWDARKESEKAGGAAELTPDDPQRLLGDAVDIVRELAMAIGFYALITVPKQIAWPVVRGLSLRLMHLAALIAWHAGQRVVTFVGRDMGGTDLGRDANGHVRPISISEETAKIGPVSESKRDDVDELLREADAAMLAWGGKAADGPLARLASALRAERVRADKAEADARRHFEQACKNGSAGWELTAKHRDALECLATVLAHFSPEPTRGPTCAQKAHAFLGGAMVHPMAQEEAETNLRAELAKEREAHEKTRGALAVAESEASRWKTEANFATDERDEKGAALGRMVARWEQAVSERDGAREDLRKALAAQNVAESALQDERGVSAGLREKLAAAREDVRIVEEAAVRLARATAKGVA